MKIYYWSPFFTNIATIKAVIKSAESLIKFSKNKFNVSLINSIGEWDKYKNDINSEINIINLNKIKLIKYLPKNGFLKSRISYMIIFFWNFINQFNNMFGDIINIGKVSCMFTKIKNIYFFIF